MENLDNEYRVDYSKRRIKQGFDGKSEDALRARQWLLQNHRQIEEKYGLPEGTLVALAAHESHFDPYARSWSGAQGLFQFTGSTGKSYGLQIGNGVDERLDYRKAADAAARYVSDEIKRRGSLALALAQWNGGGNAVNYAKEGRIHEYRSPNGTMGETHGFLQGLRKKAREFGFNHIAEDIDKNVYGGISNFAEKPAPQTLYPATNGKEAVTNLMPLYGESWRRQQMKQNAAPVALPSKAVSFMPGQQEKKPLHDLMPLYQGLAENYRVFRSGGSLLQMSEGGKIESVLKGEERIYSRGDTKRLVELARKAKDKNDFFLLGKFFYDATKKQDSRPPEYVEE